VNKKWQPGSGVSVVDEDLKGILVSISEGMAVLEDVHGFRHEYPLHKLVPEDRELYDHVPVRKKAEPLKTLSKKHNEKLLRLDLHFERLVRNPQQYSSYERLLIQRERLLDTLEFCRTHRLKKLEIIHGIGDGTLQKMVYDVLESQLNLDFHNNEILHEQSGTVLVYLK